MNTSSGSQPAVIDFESEVFNIVRHQTGRMTAFTVEPVNTHFGFKAVMLELALEIPDPNPTQSTIEALAIDAMPYDRRLWMKLPADVRAHYRALASRALAATRPLLAAAS